MGTVVPRLAGVGRASLATLAAGMVMLGSAAGAAAAPGSAPPKPSLTVPALSSVSASDCFPLLIQWTKTQNLGQVQVNVSYLDPKVIVSCVKNTYPSPAAQRVQAKKQVAGFPQKLRVELRILAPGQGTLAASKWHVSLKAGGNTVSSTSGSVTQPPTLVSKGTGTAYQTTMTFVIADPGKEFLPPKTKKLSAEATGPPGNTTVSWDFSGKAPAKASGTSSEKAGYVPILGWTVIAVGVLLLGALWVTRPVREQEA